MQESRGSQRWPGASASSDWAGEVLTFEQFVSLLRQTPLRREFAACVSFTRLALVGARERFNELSRTDKRRGMD